MRFSGSLLSSFILFVSSFSPFGRVLSQIVATFLGLSKCGVTIAECAHVHRSVQSAWNVYNLPRTAAAEISTELDESWMCVCLSLKLLQSLVSPAAPEISFPSALVVFSLSVSSELNFFEHFCRHSFCLCFRFRPLGEFFHRLLRRFLDCGSVVSQLWNVHTYTALHRPPGTFTICRELPRRKFPLNSMNLGCVCV